jgi:hypothetical protein
MNLNELAEALKARTINGTLTLGAGDLASADLDDLLKANFPQGRLILQGEATQLSSTQIQFAGATTDLFGASSVPATATFSIAGDAVALVLSCTPASYSFGSGFPVFTRSARCALTFSGAEFTLSSTTTSDVPKGVAFRGGAELPPTFQAIATLLGAAQTIEFIGSLRWVSGLPDITLVSTVFNEVPIGRLAATVTLSYGSAVTAPITPTSQPRAVPRFRLNASFDITLTKGPLTLDFVTDMSPASFALVTMAAQLDQVSPADLANGLATLLGGQDLTLPPDIPIDSQFDLGLGLVLAPASAKIVGLNAQIESASPWTIVDGHFVVDVVRVIFQVDDPFGSGRQVFTILGGSLSVNQTVQLDLTCSLPGRTLTARLASGSTVPLSSILAGFLPDADLPSLSIIELDLALDIETNDFQFQIDIVEAWPLDAGGPKSLSFDELILYLVRGDGQVAARVFCGLDIAGTRMQLSAVFQTGQGWVFTGGTTGTQSIPLSSILSEALACFNLSLPAIAPQITLTNVQMSLATSDTSFSFTCNGTVLVASATVGIDVEIGRAHEAAQNSVQTTFVGHFTIAGQLFSADFNSGSTGRAVLFMWAIKTGPLSFESIASFFGCTLPALPEDLDLGLIAAELYYDFDTGTVVASAQCGHGQIVFASLVANTGGTASVISSAATSGRDYLLCLSIARDIDLAALPVAGPLIAAAGDIQLAGLSLLAASRAFNAAELDAAFTVLSNAPSGRDVPAGLAFEASMVFACTPALLTLTISAPGPGPRVLAVASAAASSAAAPIDATEWVDVHRTCGPVRIDRIGLRYAQSVLSLMFDAGMAIGVMEVSLDGLGFGSRLDHFSPSFSLEGLGVQYQSGPITLAGGLLHTNASHDGGRYDGTLQLSTDAVALALLGRYTPGPVRASLFVFGLLDEPTIGGPPYFFVQGLAVGIGYNNRLNLPSLQGVPDFSLVKAAFPSQNPFAAPNDLTAVLARMGTDFQDEPGEYWLAAGVRFSSFELVQSFALVTAEFGNKLVFSILGLSQVSIPPGADAPLVFAELAFEATLDPDSGVLKVLGQLTNNSYVLSRSCRLGGGFAYCVWFADGAGARAGDFVYTQGGYHPAFKAPGHYPVVPRLSLSWQVDDNLSVTGQAYFAVTPRCLMAGGMLSAIYECGSISAWFDCSADFLLSWKPFRYEADIGCSVGVSFTLHLVFCSITINVSVAVDLHLEGPDFGGTVHIDLRLVSFSISFGADSKAPGYLHWDEFSASFLPAPSCAAMAADPPLARPGVVMAVAKGGLARDLSAMAGATDTRWVFHGEQLAIAVNTPIPAKQITFNAVGVDAGAGTWSDGACVGPMGVAADAFQSVLTLTLEIREDAGWKSYQAITLTPILRALPASLWLPSGGTRPGPLDGLPGGPALLEDALAGFMLSPPNVQPDITCEVNIEAMIYEAASEPIPVAWAVPVPAKTDDFAAQLGPDGRLSFQDRGVTVTCGNRVLDAILVPATAAARTAAVAAMAAMGLPVDLAIDVTNFGSATVLNDWPRICLLGEELQINV